MNCVLFVKLKPNTYLLLILFFFRSTRFRGGHQQDSHELLRHLMEGIKDELSTLKRLQQVRSTTRVRRIASLV